MTDDEKDRALCEAHCNSAADEYFNARPQLDSSVNRRIFYAGHRKAWIERGEVVRLNAQALPAAPQPAQPLADEKDALLRQALEALEGFANITNDSQGVKGYHLNGDIAEWDEFDEVDAASNTIEAIRNHLGVKND